MAMALSQSQLIVCRKHPFEHPQPGICPSCLRQRLSDIANAPTSSNCYAPPSSSSDYFYPTFYSSDHSSPDRGFGSPARRHHRVASDVLASISMAVGSGLNKSRSVVGYGPRKGGAGRSDDLKRKKKRGAGFWSKLRILSVGGGRGG